MYAELGDADDLVNMEIAIFPILAKPTSPPLDKYFKRKSKLLVLYRMKRIDKKNTSV
jgi:hypothetical protein